MKTTIIALSETLLTLATKYTDARRRSGEALLDAAGYLAQARAEARHGEWYLFLASTHTSPDTAEHLLNIRERAAFDLAFANAIKSNWLSLTTAAILARPNIAQVVVDQALNGDMPPTQRGILAAICAANPDAHRDLPHITNEHEEGDAVGPRDNAMAMPSRADLDQDWAEWEAQATEPGHRDESMLSPTFESKSNEWYTPAIYIEAARSVLGQIDLDPASCEDAQRIVQAGTYYTIDDDGLSRNWSGCVWLNPPYGTLAGKSVAGIWIARLIEQYQIGRTTAAIILVNAATEHKWFAPLWEHPICFTNHRIKFISARDDQPVQPLIGSAFAYLGPTPNRFAATFQQFGPVVFQYKDNGYAS